jgi:serine/threonine protein kinase
MGEMVGRTVSHYRIVERLGAGGMGVVYKAEDLRLGRLVALKFLSEKLGTDRAALERFQREARAASALNHPNICTIYEIDELDGKPFLVMEFLEGTSLAETPALTADQLIDLGIELADALSVAHQSGIIHRDLKPANLFRTRLGHLKILDFGLAKLTSAAAERSIDPTAQRLTGAGATVGTIAYMAPEQALGESIDARADLFSAGAVLYELATGTSAFSGSTPAAVSDAILHRQPVPPSRVRPEVDPDLEQIILKALEKDRKLRYQSASEIGADLLRLKRKSISGPAVPRERPRRRNTLIATAVVVVVLAAVGAGVLWRMRPSPSSPPANRQTTIAVLPFANLGDQSHDYLRLALPDEIITVLSYTPSLAVRPFALTRKYASDSDPQEAGRQLKVADVITGHFRGTSDRLGITLEAIDVQKNQVLWRDSVEVPAQDLISLRGQLSERVRRGLLPLLAGDEYRSERTRPANDEAYQLYLRAAAIPFDPAPNKEALDMLERVVQLDPNFASGWNALANRVYLNGQYGGGGDVAFARSEEATTRALTLDPNLQESSRRLIVLRAEGGELEEAYRQARGLLKRWPDSGQAHFAMSYVLRYAGLLSESVKECELARAVDPANFSYRSCGFAYLHLGNLERARQFFQLDAGSEWNAQAMMLLSLREGNRAEAVRLLKSRPKLWRIAHACLIGGPEELPGAAARQLRNSEALRDGEPAYINSTLLPACGRDKEALSLIGIAIQKGYCSYPAMETEPAFARLRSDPEFQRLREAGKQCQARFLRFRASQGP